MLTEMMCGTFVIHEKLFTSAKTDNFIRLNYSIPYFLRQEAVEDKLNRKFPSLCDINIQFTVSLFFYTCNFYFHAHNIIY